MKQELVKPAGSIYDLTHLVPGPEEKEESSKVITWQRIHSRRNPDIAWAHQWVGDLSKSGYPDVRNNKARLLCFQDDDEYIFLPYRSLFHFTVKDGMLKMSIWQGGVIPDEWKRKLQERWPGKIIVVVAKKHYKNGETASVFGPTTFEELNLITPELTEDDILWEKRHLAEKEKQDAIEKLEKAQKHLAELGR